jgi:hypothetical protein
MWVFTLPPKISPTALANGFVGHLALADGHCYHVVLAPYMIALFEMDSLCHSPSDDIEMLHMDNAQEYISLRNHMRREVIPRRCLFSMAYSPSQNGITERRIGLIVLKMRSLLLEGDLPKILWEEAAL